MIVRPAVVFGEGNRGNVYELLRQIMARRFVMVGSGRNRKSIAYVGNLSAFLMYVSVWVRLLSRLCGWSRRLDGRAGPDRLDDASLRARSPVIRARIPYANRVIGVAEDVRPALGSCDVFVLPSYYPEGTPRTVLEALAMGKPVITTDAPGCRETVIDGGNGFLIPTRDVTALAGAMRKFVQEPRLIPEMGVRSRRLAETHYDVEQVNGYLWSEVTKVARVRAVDATIRRWATAGAGLRKPRRGRRTSAEIQGEVSLNPSTVCGWS